MKKTEYLELLTSVDVMNTLNGGKTEAKVKLSQLDDHREIRVRIPGIDSNGIEVEVNNDHVSIFYTMDLESMGKTMRLPYPVYNKQQPYFIDVSKINSTVEDGELIVKLPFNQLANGYHKRVNPK